MDICMNFKISIPKSKWGLFSYTYPPKWPLFLLLPVSMESPSSQSPSSNHLPCSSPTILNPSLSPADFICQTCSARPEPLFRTSSALPEPLWHEEVKLLSVKSTTLTPSPWLGASFIVCHTLFHNSRSARGFPSSESYLLLLGSSVGQPLSQCTLSAPLCLSTSYLPQWVAWYPLSPQNMSTWNLRIWTYLGKGSL